MLTTDPNEFQIILKAQLDRWNLPSTAMQLDQLLAHYQAMIEANRLHNLTRITKPGEAALQLYGDSLAPVVYFHNHQIQPKDVVDIGSGAGFPAFPLAVFIPTCRVVAIDGRGKKTRFLNETAQQIGIKNLFAIHTRAEDYSPDHRFDIATCKAVGSLSDCMKWTAPLLNPGGLIVIFKSLELDPNEESDAKKTARHLRLNPQVPWPYHLGEGPTTISRSLRFYNKADE